MRKKEESARAKEQFQVRMWEKRKNRECDQKMLVVQHRMLEIENWKKHVQRREQYLQISKEQEMERQSVFDPDMSGDKPCLDITTGQTHMEITTI